MEIWRPVPAFFGFGGMRAILIEREVEYLADIDRSMSLLTAGPDERKRVIAKLKVSAPLGGMFPGIQEAAE